MSKLAFYCHIDKKSYELPKYLYPHARHNSDPEKYAGLWRFREKAGASPKSLSNYINGCPDRVGTEEAINMVKILYTDYHPHLLMQEDTKVLTVIENNLLYQFEVWLDMYDKKGAKNWSEVEKSCKQMLELVADIELKNIKQHHLQKAYNALPPNPQVKVVKAMSAFFGYILKNDYMPQMTDNPFVKDGKWSLQRKSLESAKTNRLRVLKSEVRAMIEWAEKNNQEWLSDALQISFLLGLRCSDVVMLNWRTYRPNTEKLLIEVGKSKHLAKHAIRLVISAETHPEVMAIIKRRYENRDVVLTPEKVRYGKIVAPPVIEKSDWIFYRRPVFLPKEIPEGKSQFTQINAKYYSKQVRLAREGIPAIVEREKAENGYICLHEIRSLFARIAAAKGYDNNTIRDALAHQSKTKGALEGHYLDGTNITPQCLVTMADLQGAEIDDLFHDFGDAA